MKPEEFKKAESLVGYHEKILKQFLEICNKEVPNRPKNLKKSLMGLIKILEKNLDNLNNTLNALLSEFDSNVIDIPHLNTEDPRNLLMNELKNRLHKNKLYENLPK